MNTDSRLFLQNLAEIHDAESRIAMALAKMNKADTSTELKREILSLLQETEHNLTGVEEIYNHFSALVEKGDSNVRHDDPRAHDLTLISSLKSITDAGPPVNGSQRAWELASYGYLHEWDGLSDRLDAANLLEAIIEEETHDAPDLIL